MQTISSLTIVKDEQRWISHMIDFLGEYVKPDEMVVVDGGSTDDTLQVIDFYIKRGFPIKLIENVMPDSFSEQRNLALDNCTGDWVLHIDADETYSKNIVGLVEKVRQGSYEECLGIVFPTAHLIGDERHMNDSGGDVHIRMFKNLPEIRFKGDVHEQLYYNDQTLLGINIRASGDVVLRHFSMLKSQEELILKGKRYLQWTERSQLAGIPITEDEKFFVKAIENRISQGPLIEVPEEWM